MPVASIRPDDVLRHIFQHPALHMLATNPLLLSIMCIVARKNGVLPETRAKLYDEAVNLLLARSEVREVVSYPYELPLARKRSILERSAFWLFAGMQEERTLTFSGSQFLDTLTAAVIAEGKAQPADVADVLLRDLTANTRIVTGEANEGYTFLHLTFQEYLAAAHLAKIINKDGWDQAQVWVGNKQLPIPLLLSRKAWDPDWQEVIVLLAGQLDDPKPLLEMLSDPKPTDTNPTGDDLFRHRLALSALCLPELAQKQRKECSDLVDTITTEIFRIWREAKWGIESKHLSYALPFISHSDGLLLENIKGNTQGKPLLAALLLTQNQHGRYPINVVYAICKISVNITKEGLDLLPSFIQNSSMRENAAKVIGEIGFASKEILAALTTSFKQDSFVQGRATKVIMLALLTLLRDHGLLYGEAKTIDKSDAVVTKDTKAIIAIRSLLHDQDWRVRSLAVETIGQLGAAYVNVTKEIIAALLQCDDSDYPLDYLKEGHHSRDALANLMQQGIRIFSQDGDFKHLPELTQLE